MMELVCTLPLLASLFGCPAPELRAVGYVEGEYVLLAPIEIAQIGKVAVRRGDIVQAGAMLVEMENTDARIAVAQAEAGVAAANAQLADLQLGKRKEEIAVLETTLASNSAQAEQAQRVLERTQDLFRRGSSTQAQLDAAQTALSVAQAMVAQAKANLDVARLPARHETIRAAESQAQQAQAVLDQAKWRLSKRVLVAPATARVDDVIRDPGDIAGPSAPVLSLLPEGAVKLKVYVPEAAFSTVSMGGRLKVHCDGCGEGLTATVSYISPEPEFTPPVIYSLEARQKLVYLVEARPDAGVARLQPGQIVDVDLQANTVR